MSLFGFGKRPRHKSFDYKPRYYDQEKEDLEARLGKYNEEEKDNTEAMKSRIRGGFRKPIRRSYETDEYKRALKRSNRIVVFVALLLIIVVIYFLLIYFPKFLESFE